MAGIVVALVGLALGMSPLFDSGPDVASTSSQQDAKPAVQQVDVDRYWRENFVTTSWYQLTSPPVWEGSWLVARTKLHPDEDAREYALSICRAMVTYWYASSLEFHPVRVLDKGDGLLASAHSETSPCAWRR